MQVNSTVGAIVNWVMKVTLDCCGFALLRSVIGPENSRHFLNQSDTKLKPELVARVFPRFAQSACLYFEFSLKIKGIFLLVIGCYNYFGFGFATVNQKALYLMISGLS